MADEVIPVSQQSQWRVSQSGSDKYFDQSGDVSAPGTYTHTTDSDPWPSALTGSNQRIRIDLQAMQANNLALKFFGAPASVYPQSGDQVEGLAAFWGVSQMTDGAQTPTIEYAGEYLGKVRLAVGKTAGVTSQTSILPATPAPFFVREIAVLEDHSIFPAFRIVGQEDEAAPILVFDTIGYRHVIVEMRRQAPGQTGITTVAATDLGFLYRVI